MSTTTTTEATEATTVVEGLRSKGLTPRQAEVFVMIHPTGEDGDRAMTNKAVAEALGIDAGTVSNAYTEARRTLGLTVATPAGRKAKVPQAKGKAGMAEAILTEAIEAFNEAGAPKVKAEDRVKAIGTPKGKAAFIEDKAKAIAARIEVMQAEAEALTTDEGKAKAIEAEAKAATEALKAAEDVVTGEAVEALTEDVRQAIVAAKALGFEGEALTEAEAIAKAS